MTAKTTEVISAAKPKLTEAAAPMAFRAEGGLAPSTFEEAWRMAQLFSRSELVPKDYLDKPENCLVAIQMGAELGLKPLQALQGIAVINGRPSVWGDALWALVQSSPVVEDAHEIYEGDAATCVIKRRDRSKPTVQTFSRADAELAGLWNKAGPWRTNPRRMLQMRARAFAARDAVPDVLKGLVIAEEAFDLPPVRTIEAEPEAPKTGMAAVRAKARESAPPASEAEAPAPAVPEDARKGGPEPERDSGDPGASADWIAQLDEFVTADALLRWAANKVPPAIRNGDAFAKAFGDRMKALKKGAQ